MVTKIYYGDNRMISITSEQYNNLLKVFRGKTVNIGTSRTNTPNRNVEE